ncbi:MAG: ATP cone domain-containing protein [Planctomycetota bacterium]
MKDGKKDGKKDGDAGATTGAKTEDGARRRGARRRGSRGGRGRNRSRATATPGDPGAHRRTAASQAEIVKTSGDREPFDEAKLRGSLRRAGASAADQDRVVAEVRDKLRPETTTRQLYRIAFDTLRSRATATRKERSSDAATAARYSLQRAILELGPSGFPFEQFLGELLRHEGWDTRVGVRLQGEFVQHEVDLDAVRNGRRILAECKFRLDPNGKVDVKTALYVFGRAEDLRRVRGGYDRFWIVTNGRFTSDALHFGEGNGLYLLGWNHPAGESLRERIDRAGLHPVTCLTHLRKTEKQRLIRDGVVVVADLHDEPRALDKLKLSNHRLANVRGEVDALCER